MKYDYDSSYQEDHSVDHCDICEMNVGEKNLKRLPFQYHDKNDKVHPDFVDAIGCIYKHYKQYFVCVFCYRESKQDKRKY